MGMGLGGQGMGLGEPGMGLSGLPTLSSVGGGMGGFDAQRLVHAGRILDNDETLMAAGVAKQPQVCMW